jgi:hypothetical protein
VLTGALHVSTDMAINHFENFSLNPLALPSMNTIYAQQQFSNRLMRTISAETYSAPKMWETNPEFESDF